jgi:two-component system, NarL family, response regulator DegU
MDKINLLIADDHRLFRKAMVRLLKTFEHIGEVWEAENGKECVAKMKTHPVSVLLLDLEMPRMNGVEVAENLIPKYPDLKIIVLTMHDSEKYMIHMLELGVHSFLLKNTDPDELYLAIISVMEKDFYHSEQLSMILRNSIKEKIPNKRPVFKKTISLTDREREILELICKEKSTKEISHKLAISEGTINVHKHNLQTKLGVKSVIGLIRFAYESGLMR